MFKKRNDFDQYLKNVRISFPVFHKAERRFFQDFSANVSLDAQRISLWIIFII